MVFRKGRRGKIAVFVLLSLAAGVSAGALLPASRLCPICAGAEGYLLGAMMIFSGILLGSGGALKAFRGCGASVLALPAATVLGSGLGGLVCGTALGFPAAASLAISEGMCWYTLSGALVGTSLGGGAGTAAFLCGLFREAASLALIPWLVKRAGVWEASSAAAATSGDVCLPVLLRCGGAQASAAAIINGAVCTGLVPLLVPLCLSLT